MTKLSVPDVLERFKKYKSIAGNESWGSLHIALDDGNLNNNSVEWCKNYAKEKGDKEGEELAEILLCLSFTQRRRLKRLV